MILIDKVLEKRQKLTGVSVEQPPEIPVDITAARQNIGYFYGDTVKVSHLNSEGTPFDNIVPSFFVMNFIQYNFQRLRLHLLNIKKVVCLLPSRDLI